MLPAHSRRLGLIPTAWLLAVAVAMPIGVLAMRAPLLALGLCAALLVGLAALRAPEVATCVVLFLLYSNLPVVSATFHGVPRVVAAAFPLLLAVPLLRDLVIRRRPLVWTPVLSLLVLFVGAQAIAMGFSRAPRASLESVLASLLEGVGLYLLVTNAVRSKAALRGATWALLLAGIPMSLVPLHQQATGTFERDYGGLAQVDGLGFRTGEQSAAGGEERQARLAGPIGEKNRYAQVMLVLLPLGLACFWGERSRALRAAALACTGLAGLGFGLAFSRGGAVGLACLLATMLALRLIDARRMLVVLAGLALLLLALPQYWKRIASLASVAHLVDETAQVERPDGAVRRRATEMLAAARAFLDHPLIGVGPGLFKDYAEEYGKVDALRRIEGPRHAHSLYLGIAAETGIVGLCLFLAAVTVALVGLAAARRATLASDPELANLAGAYLLALVCHLSTGVFLHLAYLRYFYLVLALGGAVNHVARHEPRAAPARLRPALAAGGTA